MNTKSLLSALLVVFIAPNCFSMDPSWHLWRPETSQSRIGPTMRPPRCSKEALHEAIKINNIATVRRIIEDAPQLVNARCKYGETPLHVTAEKGHQDIAKFLIAKGAKIDARNGSGSTPLYSAALWGQYDFAKFLIAKGAKIDARNRGDWTPLHAVANTGREGSRDIVELLLSRGAQVDAGCVARKTPLYVAAMRGHLDVVECLIEGGADINALFVENGTVLHYAAEEDFNLDVVELLLQHGADIDAVNDTGETALLIALQFQRTDIVKELVKRYASVGVGERAAEIMAYLGALPPRDHRNLLITFDERRKFLKNVLAEELKQNQAGDCQDLHKLIFLMIGESWPGEQRSLAAQVIKRISVFFNALWSGGRDDS